MLKYTNIVKYDRFNLEKVKQTIQSCLGQVPFLKTTEFKKNVIRGKYHFDFTLRILTPDYKKTLIGEIKISGQPRVVREAVNQLFRYREVMPQAGLIFVAPYVSMESAKICEQEGVSYVDFAGNCLLTFDSVYIKNQGNPNPFSEKRELRSLYSPRATRVLRALLAYPRKFWKLQELSEMAQVSLGQASNIKKILENKEWLVKQKEGLQITFPEKVLGEWVSHYHYRQNSLRECYSLRDAEEFEKFAAVTLKKKKITYAFTGFSAAARMASMVRYKRVMLFVPESYQDEALSLLELKEVSNGANVNLLSPYDNGVFFYATEKDGLSIVSPIQTFLDLSSYRGRGEEAAQEILDKEIRPLW